MTKLTFHRMPRILSAALLLLGILAGGSATAAEATSKPVRLKTTMSADGLVYADVVTVARASGEQIADGDFERSGLRFTNADRVGEWRVFNHGKSDARASIVEGEGHQSPHAVRYTRTTVGSDNFHLDQFCAVESNATFEVSAWVRADGRLNPMLAVMTLKWRVLAAVPSNAGTNWTHVSFIFISDDSERVRFELFPGATGKLYEGGPGTSWLDEVSITKLENVPLALQRALDLTRSRKNERIETPEALGRDGSPNRPRTPRGGVPTVTHIRNPPMRLLHHWAFPVGYWQFISPPSHRRTPPKA